MSATENAREMRLKRLRHRSWRRGVRETDLLLGPFADAALAGLDDGLLDAFERLLEENDWDIYYWVAGAIEVPPEHAPLIEQLRLFHKT